MRAAVVSFTGRGSRLNRKIVEILKSRGWDCEGWTREKFAVSGLNIMEGTLADWTGKNFPEADALIFVGACGIAVRAVAPWVKDKFQDPAVVAADEGGQFVISLLSGHAGGANRLTRELAAALGAVPVITTATDVNGRFAVDVFAAENGCAISSRDLAKQLSFPQIFWRESGFLFPAIFRWRESFRRRSPPGKRRSMEGILKNSALSQCGSPGQTRRKNRCCG